MFGALPCDVPAATVRFKLLLILDLKQALFLQKSQSLPPLPLLPRQSTTLCAPWVPSWHHPYTYSQLTVELEVPISSAAGLLPDQPQASPQVVCIWGRRHTTLSHWQFTGRESILFTSSERSEFFQHSASSTVWGWALRMPAENSCSIVKLTGWPEARYYLSA